MKRTMLRYELRMPKELLEEFKTVVPEGGTVSGAIRALMGSYIEKQRNGISEGLEDPRFSVKTKY